MHSSWKGQRGIHIYYNIPVCHEGVKVHRKLTFSGWCGQLRCNTHPITHWFGSEPPILCAQCLWSLLGTSLAAFHVSWAKVQ